MRSLEWKVPPASTAGSLCPVCITQEGKFFVESMGIGGLKKVEKLEIVAITEGEPMHMSK